MKNKIKITNKVSTNIIGNEINLNFLLFLEKTKINFINNFIPAKRRSNEEKNKKQIPITPPEERGRVFTAPTTERINAIPPINT